MKKGISIIALIITIIVLIILTGTVIMTFTNGGIIDKAKGSVFKNDLTSYRDELAKSIMDAQLKFEIGSKEEVNAVKAGEENNNILKWIPDLSEKYIDKVEIQKGELLYTGTDEKEIDWSIDINIFPKNGAAKWCERYGHSFELANYLYPEICSKCGLSQGEKLAAPVSKHPEQKNSEDIGIGADGQLVNLDSWTYNSSYAITYNANYTKSYNGKILDGSIVDQIPQMINGNEVKQLNFAFKDCTELINPPVLPNSITSMNSTFLGCTGLMQAPAIPNTVTDMNSTFSGCAKIKNAPILPDNVTCLNLVFNDCTNLEETPTIPSKVTYLVETFKNCSKLTETPILPNNIKNISGAFSGCSGLTQTPVIPNSVTAMFYTFDGCTGLTETPIIPKGVTDMRATFSGCTGLTEPPVLPTGITSLGSTFSGCTSLKKAPKIPNKVDYMGDTFKNCTSLIEASDIPSNVTGLNATFMNCTSLTKAPIIGTGVKFMKETFYGCTNLSGTVQINSQNITSFTNCFYGIQNTITVRVPENSTTYNTLINAYGNSSKINIETF